MDVTPAPLGLGSAWSLLGSLPVWLPSQGWFLAKTASPSPRLACLPRQRLGVQHFGWMLTGPFLLCWPHPPRSVRVMSKYLP